MNAALACSLATLLLLLPVYTLPLLQVSVYGQQSEKPLIIGIVQLWHRGWILLAGLTGLLVIVLPAVHHALMSMTLGAVRLGRRPRWLGGAFRWAVWLEPWAMVDVLLLALAVGYFYLAVIEHIDVTLKIGSYCLAGAGILAMLSRASLDARTVWRAVGRAPHGDGRHRQMACRTCGLGQALAREGGPCARCGASVHRRKRDAIGWTAALLIASCLLLFPANLLPMNISTMFGKQTAFTNFGYVRQFWHMGLWPLSVIVFWTDVLTPAIMVVMLAWCVLSVSWRTDRWLLLRTRLFRVIAQSGRWSNSAPFSIVILAPLIDFGALGTEAAAVGATAFIVMVLLIMLAASTFDPRLMWDARGTAPRR